MTILTLAVMLTYCDNKISDCFIWMCCNILFLFFLISCQPNIAETVVNKHNKIVITIDFYLANHIVFIVINNYGMITFYGLPYYIL